MGSRRSLTAGGDMHLVRLERHDVLVDGAPTDDVGCLLAGDVSLLLAPCPVPGAHEVTNEEGVRDGALPSSRDERRRR